MVKVGDIVTLSDIGWWNRTYWAELEIYEGDRFIVEEIVAIEDRLLRVAYNNCNEVALLVEVVDEGMGFKGYWPLNLVVPASDNQLAPIQNISKLNRSW
jgi:hypothetical protein